MTSSLSTTIVVLEAKAGKDWTHEEHEACREWLIAQKWSDLEREVSHTVPSTPADDRVGVMAAFLNGKLESVLRGYKPEFSGLWPYVLVCLRRYCWQAAGKVNRERGLTRPIMENEAEPAFLDLSSLSPGAPPGALLDRVFQVLVQQKFASLEPGYREPLLRRVRGAAYEEIARDLGLSIPVVKIRIFRARQKLRKALRAAWSTDIF